MAIEKSCDFCENQKWFDRDLMYGCGKGLLDKCKQGNTYTLFKPKTDYAKEAKRLASVKVSSHDDTTEASLTD